MTRTFKYPSRIQEIQAIRKDLELLGKEWSISPSESKQILLIIEELFSNIIRYAFEDTKAHVIEVRLSRGDGEIVIEMIDDGLAFNPLEHDSTPSDDPATSITGGMGLTLIRTFSSKIVYRRSTGKNHLSISKSVRSK